MTSQSQGMLDACTAGDVVDLQRRFDTNNIQNSDPVYQNSTSGPPPVNSMLVAAITHGHVDVVSLILRTYSGRNVQFTSETIEALLHHPNLDILQTLYEYDPFIVSFEWDGHTDTFVTKACAQPPNKITPLLLWLIEHDADLEGGHFPRTLCNAIFGDQTLGVIEAMVNKGAQVSTLAMRQAVVCERIDVMNLFVSRGMKVDADDAAYLRSEAEQTGNEEAIQIVKKWTSNKSCVVS
ncbi:hypothetical protein OPT61_g582 [Boeremia exigua]|uniref:Uncharacterized protein n=1 Tax=Boeremia exigua TaxID=749465 RepID=A0ACC2ITS4_9PLEO|nr:hypothetical protein OPT61_g582 [Boeremia exigua]